MVNELQRSRIELQERVEMLDKAIAAKDFQIESADNKVASLSERIDQITKRFDQERNTLEAANRRLTEELQNEKAERSLIQGALEIARESRTKIQKKYISLRKKTRLDTPEDDNAPEEDADAAEFERASDQVIRRGLSPRRLIRRHKASSGWAALSPAPAETYRNRRKALSRQAFVGAPLFSPSLGAPIAFASRRRSCRIHSV